VIPLLFLKTSISTERGLKLNFFFHISTHLSKTSGGVTLEVKCHSKTKQNVGFALQVILLWQSVQTIAQLYN